MVKVCAIYVRKSKINDNSDSMETQIQMCTDYLNQQFPGCIIKICDKDYGITGHSIKKRKDFQRMMDDVRSGSINIVAIQRYDRIARNTRDFCNIYHDMEKVGCELISVSQRIDTSTPYGKKFMYDLASTAELEWALNSERHKDTNKYARLNRKCALSPYALPFGIKTEIRDGKRVAVIDKEKEHIIRDAIQYYKENKSKAKTVRYINAKYGLNRSHSFIDTLLKSDFYHGEYREVPDYCEAYMTKEEHEELRNISSGKIRYYSNDKNYFLFTGKLICPVCGLKMESQSQINTSGNRYYYYRCYNTYRSGNCTFKGNINERYVEDYLINNIDFIFEQYAIELSQQKQKIEHKQIDVSKYKEELDRLNTMFLKGRIDEKTYDKEYERIQRIILEHDSTTDTPNPFDLDDLRKLFYDGWENHYIKFSRGDKRKFWSNVIKEIHFNDDKTVKTVIL